MDHRPFLGIDKYNCGVEHTIKDLHLLVGHKGSPVLEQKQKGEKLDDKYAQSSSRTGNKYSELNQISILGVTSQKLLEAYAKDNWLKKIKTCLKTKKLDPLLSNSLKLDKITIFDLIYITSILRDAKGLSFLMMRQFNTISLG